MIARRGKSKRNQVLRAHFIEIRKKENSKNRKVVCDIPTESHSWPGEHKNKITKLTPREILELFVDDVAHTISREYSFLLLKILRRHRTDRDLTTRNIIYYRDNLWIIVLVKSKNARYAYRIGPEMLLLCARLAVESSAPITYVIEPFPTSHGLASLPSISWRIPSRREERKL